MGRLQRKKTPAKKKKKKQSAEIQASLQASSDVVLKKTSSISGSAKDIKKKQPVAAQQRTSIVSRTSPSKPKNFIDKGLQFLREVKVELKKVTWPSRKQTIGSTVVVIILVLIVSIFLGVVDIGLSNLVRVVLQ
ncbi:preprotein translocase subunit SecE [Thermodesulfobacteriota bacterium]